MRAAIVNSELNYPRGRLTVNLVPADLSKEGPAYDLPIAVALLILAEQIGSALDADTPSYACDLQDIMGLISWKSPGVSGASTF